MRELRTLCRCASLSAITFILAFPVSVPAASYTNDDFEGRRFSCNDPAWVNICLAPLKPGSSLSIAPGRGLPREPDDKLILVSDKQAWVITGPVDLVGHVDIKSEQDALEYLRFFSSFRTVHLFAAGELEVFKGKCFAVCLSSERWRNLGLSDARVALGEDGFDVTRYVIKPTERIPEVQLYRVLQRVRRDGNVLTLESVPVPLSIGDRLRLSFPRFL